MLSPIVGRSPLVYLVALVTLLALMAGVVSAKEAGPRKRLTGAMKLERPTCKGSGVRATKFGRLCNHARIGPWGRERHRGPRAQAPAQPPAAGLAPSGTVAAEPAPASNPVKPAPNPTPPPPSSSGEPEPEVTPEPEVPTPTPEPPEPEVVPEPEVTPEPEAPPPDPEPEVTPPPTPEPEPPAEPPPPSPLPGGSIYWGAWISDHLTGEAAPWDMGAVASFEQMTDKGVSLVNFSAPFANCSSSSCDYYEFPAGEFSKIRSHGAIPFYSWGSQSIPAPANLSQPDFQLSDVISGAHDTFIRRFATAAREWGKPFFLRFNWEMNGGWFAWAEGVNGNQPGEYVAAWRHVHDIFEQVGATNATWVWCPNVDPDNRFQALGSLYPGDAYVDWTGLDGYNWGTNPARPDRWRSFDDLYRSTYEEITTTIAPSKPLIVSEVGSTEYGGSKADWIDDMLDVIPASYPKIRGLLWFERYDDGMDWPLATSSSAAAAFAAGIDNPLYLGNQLGSLGGGSVQAAG